MSKNSEKAEPVVDLKADAEKAPAAATVEKKAVDPVDALLAKLVLVQKGKRVDGKPVSDNYGVAPKAGAKDLPDWKIILDTLRAAFPRCVFTYLAKIDG